MILDFFGGVYTIPRGSRSLILGVTRPPDPGGCIILPQERHQGQLHQDLPQQPPGQRHHRQPERARGCRRPDPPQLRQRGPGQGGKD